MPLFRHRKRSAPGNPPDLPAKQLPPPPSFPPDVRPRTSAVSTLGRPRTNDAETRREIASAFRAVNDTSRGPLPGPQNEMLLSIQNKAVTGLGMLSTSMSTAAYNTTTTGAHNTTVSTPAAGKSVVTARLADDDQLQNVRDGISKLSESLPTIVKALEDVSKIHPFIAGAAGRYAFKVVIELNLKRADNDRKIGVLFGQMRDTMEALLQLRTIRDEDSKGPGGVTIKARLQNLVIQTATDIKACANVCDTYLKTRSVVKVIMSGSWDDTLRGHIDLFIERRREFMFALAMHTGKGVDRANRKLDVLEAKLDAVLEYFQKATTPEQLELAAIVAKRGGPEKVMQDDAILQELLYYNVGPDSDAAKGAGRDGETEAEELALVFDRKFRIQQRELMEEVRRAVHHEGDRVIAAMNAGAHDRIFDPEIHAIWKEMSWPGHVKSRHFVLALRDYYRQIIMDKKRRARTELTWIPKGASRQFVTALRDRYRAQVEHRMKRQQGDDPARVSDQDEWALEWINMNRLQAIAEAFDDDASGFVTIAEVNTFTSSRPKEWSLPHWLAYWAIGWQIASTRYRDEVVEMGSKMFAIRSQIHPANRSAVDKYLRLVWKRVCTLTSSLATTYQSEALDERFKSYVDGEEQRLREGLETAKYKIDEVETLALITGPGRIEQFIMPLLYLLMRRDFEIFRIARNTLIDEKELEDSAISMLSLFDAVDERHDDLSALFVQQRLDPGNQFKTYSCELFDYWHDSSKFWSLENLRKLRFTERPYDEEEEKHTVAVSEPLNYPIATDGLYAVVEDDIMPTPDDVLNRVLGRWNGFIGERRWPTCPILTLVFKPSGSVESPSFEASGTDAQGQAYTVVGAYEIEEVEGATFVRYSFTQTYPATDDHDERLLYFRGRLDEDAILLARPSLNSYKANRTRALWRYALMASLDEARRRLFSWSYIRQRRHARLEYLDILRHQADGSTSDADKRALSALYRRLTPDDIRACFAREQLRQTPSNPLIGEFPCDVCNEEIIGAWLVCLSCGARTTINLHDAPSCAGAVVLPKHRDDLKTPHVPTHDLVKIRANLHYHREIGRVLRAAAAGLEYARGLLFGGTGAGKGARASRSDTLESAVLRRRATGKRKSRFDGDFGDGLLEERKAATPTCVSCHAPAAVPCWFCVDCPVESNVFVCGECDENKGGCDVDEHLATHTLVRCTESLGDAGEAKTAEERLTSVEGQLIALTVQMDRIEKVLMTLAGTRST
ncbi:uncharacterized protein BXZ73DRAFT_106942 [Epithele typhae]|uniref:uncharacterized protein n=1 Tax=Epithele typhae TaxID=378194 RepID=UPI002007E1DB|nr:uncharacterized protein BXZ73DRAFT_106942 [Epithele typhae]KAH9913469.1 hypothetical protein BXZ73DRAFT_106942 [Epithele typhae]